MGKASRAYMQSQGASEKMEDFLPLVRRIAGKMAGKLPPFVEMGDLVQAGCLGLAQAWSRYSSDAGSNFESFASSRIRGAMLDWLRSEDLLPKSARKEAKKIDKAIAALRHRLGREPREEDIAAELGLELSEYQEAADQFENSHMLSLEDLGVENPEDLAAADSSSDPFEALLGSQTAALLVKAIEALPEKDKLVLSLHNEQDLTFKEIAQVLDLSEARICQIHGQALARIRSSLAKR